MKAISLVAAVAIMLGVQSFANAVPASHGSKTLKPMPKSATKDLVWHDVETGFALAKRQHKPVLVDFYTEWCGWCKVMDRDTFHETNVKKLMSSKFVLVRANAEDEGQGTKLAMEYQVFGFPTIMIFDANLTPKAKVSGFKPAPEFQADLLEYLTGRPQVAREPETEVTPSAAPGTMIITAPQGQ